MPSASASSAMKYRLRHTTSYTYSWQVDISHHVLHLGLQDRPRQTVSNCRIRTTPEGAPAAGTKDHFGNRTTYLAIEEPHTRFDVELTAEIAVEPFAAPDPDTTPAWEDVAALLDGDGFPEPVAESEFVLDPSAGETDAAAAAYAQPSFTERRPILAAALDLIGRIHKEFRYDPAATDVSTPVAEVMRKRAGVCQDFAHAAIAMLRAHGLAARYVSGYIRTMQPGETGALRGADASHAWISVWCGPDHGWIDLDPTNNIVVSEDHVTTAIGRDYGDVSPVRGVVLGGGPHRINVAVELLPLGR